MSNPNDDQQGLANGEHSGRDEMNLAGLPFALLQAATAKGQTAIEQQWERRLPDGRTVMASWRVAGDEKLGLPGPAEEAVYLVMLQLTREEAAAGAGGEWPSKVFFSEQDFLARLGWSPNARSYRDLRDALTRLQAVTIQAEYCFHDARTGRPFRSRNLGILSNTALDDTGVGRKTAGQEKRSWFEWNSALHESFCAGNVRALALDFLLTLKYPTSRRLFRYLELMRHAAKPPRRSFAIGAMKLRDRLGMTPYRYPSKVREKLESAHRELKTRGYLESTEWSQAKSGEITVNYVFGAAAGAPSHVHDPLRPLEAPQTRPEVPVDLQPPNGLSLCPQAAYEVYLGLGETERLRLRDLARDEVESAFWDRLEKPESPMALILWELVATQHPQSYEARLEN